MHFTVLYITAEALTDEEWQRFDFLSEGFEESTDIGIEDASSETSEGLYVYSMCNCN